MTASSPPRRRGSRLRARCDFSKTRPNPSCRLAVFSDLYAHEVATGRLTAGRISVKKSGLLALAGTAAVAAVAVPNVAAREQRSGQHRTPTVSQAVTAHIKAVQDCNARALVDGYSTNAKVFFPDGAVVSGRRALQDVYDNFVKPREQGGYCGIRIAAVNQFRGGRTVFIKFRVTAPYLAEPYFSTDGYVISRGLIVSEVSTFDASKLKFK